MAFTLFAFKINSEALPELVDNYAFEAERKPLFEVLTEEQHVSALESVFSEGSIVGYENMLKSLQKGYETIGYKRGRNVCVELNKFLMGKGVITKKDKTYSYEPKAFENEEPI